MQDLPRGSSHQNDKQRVMPAVAGDSLFQWQVASCAFAFLKS